MDKLYLEIAVVVIALLAALITLAAAVVDYRSKKEQVKKPVEGRVDNRG